MKMMITRMSEPSPLQLTGSALISQMIEMKLMEEQRAGCSGRARRPYETLCSVSHFHLSRRLCHQILIQVLRSTVGRSLVPFRGSTLWFLCIILSSPLPVG